MKGTRVSQFIACFISFVCLTGCVSNPTQSGLSKVMDKPQLETHVRAQEGDVVAMTTLANWIEAGKFEPEIKSQESIDWYNKAAEKGHGQAFLELARVYREDRLIPADIDKAIVYLELAGEYGELTAYTELGQIYLQGLGVPVNVELGLEYLLKVPGLSPITLEVSQPEDASGFEQIDGLSAEALLDFTEGSTSFDSVTVYISTEKTEELHSQATNGDSGAAYRLAHRYKKGLQAQQDAEKACYWYAESFYNGFADGYEGVIECLNEGNLKQANGRTPAQIIAISAKMQGYNVDSFVGEHYFLPHLIPQDYEKARVFFTRAALENDDIALNNLGTIYRDGLGVSVDLEKAEYYFQRSADLGLELAMHNLAKLYSSEGYPVLNQDAVMQLIQQSAIEKGYGPALLDLAKMHLEGVGTEKNQTLALRYFHQARESGQQEAECYILALKLKMRESADERQLGDNLLQSCLN